MFTELDVEESSQDNYESDDSSSSTESTKGSQSDSNANDEPAWRREEDTIILENIQKEDDKEYALQIISDKLPNRTVAQIRSRLSRLVNLLIETLKSKWIFQQLFPLVNMFLWSVIKNRLVHRISSDELHSPTDPRVIFIKKHLQWMLCIFQLSVGVTKL